MTTDTLAKLAAHESETTVWLLAVGDDGIGSELVTGWTALRRAWLDNHRSFVDHDNLTDEDRETLSLLDDDDEWKHDDSGARFSLHVNYEGDWISVTRVDGAALTAQALPAAEPFGYFKAEPFGWVNCAETDDGAVALYERPASQFTGAFTGIAARKLAELADQGYRVNGYSLMHAETRARGFIDASGFVGWWSNRDHEQAATPKAALVAEFGEHMAGYSEGFDDGKGVAERQAAQATAGWVLVPVEPDLAMVNAGLKGRRSSPANMNPRAIWDAMLSARPQPQPQSAQSKGDA